MVVTGPASKHPAYLHALSDLRTARAFLQRPTGAPAIRWDENRAIGEVDAAINEIKRASIDDGKPLEDHPPIDTGMVWGNRLQKAVELLETARRDVNQEEDNAFASGLKNRAIGHIDTAVRFTREGIQIASTATVEVSAPPPPPPPPPPPAAAAHPAYLHALSDMRAARGFLERPAGLVIKWDEKRAIDRIDSAIAAIKKASIDDGKPLTDHPPVDTGMLWGGRLQKAKELLQQAQRDINEEEDNPSNRALKHASLDELKIAISYVDEGMKEARMMKAPPPMPPGPPAMTDHPAYLHALTDLRHARALLERPARPEVKWDENNGIREIDAAINEIKGASIDDGKPLSDHPPIDAHLGHKDRLRRAEEMLHKAAADIEEREDNAWAKGLRGRAVGHIRNAEHAIHEAIEDRRH